MLRCCEGSNRGWSGSPSYWSSPLRQIRAPSSLVRQCGKRPLAPTVSPGKTWEGAIGGFLAAVLAALAAAWALEIDVSVPVIVALGALMGVVGQAGDLFESKLKRLADVKESGRLLPGHGGVLDRLDSIVFNLALLYYFVIGGAL